MEFFHDPEFWVALAITTIILVMAPRLLKTINAGLDERANKIRAQIEEARKLREDAAALLAQYQKKQREAMAEAESIISQAKTDAARLRVELEKDLTSSIERRKQQALERIAQSEAQALKDVRNTAVDVALAAAEKLIREKLAVGQQQALADQAIAELPKRLN